MKKGTYRISLVVLFRVLTPFPLINPNKKFFGEALIYGASTQKKISKFYVVTYVVNRFFASRGFIIGLFLSWKFFLWYWPRPYLTFLLMKFCSSVKFYLAKVISAYCYSSIFYYIKNFSYEIMIARGCKIKTFVEKKNFYFIFRSIFFSPGRP